MIKNNLFWLVIILLILFGGSIYLYQTTSKPSNHYVATQLRLPNQPSITPQVTESAPVSASTSFADKTVTVPPEQNVTQPSLRINFSYPYPLMWEDGGGSSSVPKTEFMLTGIEVGKIKITQQLLTSLGLRGHLSSYNLGDEVYALVLKLRVKVLESSGMECVPLNIRRFLNIGERDNTALEGDMASPLNTQFLFPVQYGVNCMGSVGEIYNQQVIFDVPESDKNFFLTTGGKADINFSVFIEEDKIRLEVEE